VAALAMILALSLALVAFVAFIYLGFRLRRRSIARGQHPLRLLPWYLGGPQDLELKHPADDLGRRARRRHK